MICDRRVEHCVGGFDVPLELDQRDAERFTDVIEFVGPTVLGQETFQVKIRAEKIIHRVFVLTTIQTPKHRAFAAGVRVVQRLANGICEFRAMFITHRLGILRRHFAEPDTIENPLPPGEHGLIAEIRLEFVQCQASFLRSVAMTVVTVLVQQRL